MDEEIKIKRSIPIEQPMSTGDVEELVGTENVAVFSDQMAKAKSKREPAPPGINLPLVEKPTKEAAKKKLINQQDMQNILTKNSTLESIVNKAIVLTGQKKEEFLTNSAIYLPQEGVDLNLVMPAVSDAIGKYLLEIQSSAEHPQQQQLQSLIDHSKIERLAFSNPELRMLISTLKAEHQKTGISTTESEKKANHQALQSMRLHLEERLEKNLQTASPTEIQETISTLLAEKIPNVDSISAAGLAIGLTDAAQVASAFYGQMEKIANVQAPKVTNVDNLTQSLFSAVNEAQELTNAAQTMMIQTPPPLSENEIEEIKGFLKQMAHLIGGLQSLLLQLQVLEGRKGEKIAAEQRLLAEETFIKKLEEIAKQVEALIKQARLNKFLEIFMPLLGAIMMVLGVAFSPFSGGASLAATITISTTLFITTTTLSSTGTLQKGFEALGQAIEAALEKSMGSVPDFLKPLVKGLIYVAMVAVLVAGTVATRGASSNVTVKFLANMIAMQVITTVMSASNVIGHLVEGIGKRFGASDTLIMALTITFTFITMIGIGFAGGYATMKDLDLASKLGQIAPIIQKVQWLQKAVPYIQAGAMGAQGAGAIYQGAMAAIIGKTHLEEKELEALIELLIFLQQLLEKMSADLKTDGANTNELSAMLTEVFNNAVKVQRQSAQKILDKIRS